MKRRMWKYVGFAALGGFVLQAGSCSAMTESILTQVLQAAVIQALTGAVGTL